jgi:hypothetical protein
MPEQLERELREVGTHIAYPREPDLVPAVRARLEEPPRPLLARRRVLVLALAALAVAVAAAFAVPPARTAILRFFHIGGETVERVDVLPPAGRRSPVQGLRGPASLDAASRIAGFRILLPSHSTAAHKQFFADESIAATYLRVSGKAAPIVLTEFRGDLGMAKKVATPQTRIEAARVNGEDALWLEGAPHVVFYFDANARGQSRTVRLAGNALVWTRGSLTLRLEGRLSKASALRIARTVG